MAREIQTEERKAILSIKPWLLEENAKKPISRAGLHREKGYASAKSIYRSQIPGRWAELQRLRPLLPEEKLTREDDMWLRVGKLALTSCNLARTGFVYHAVARGENVFDAENKAWVGLEKYTTEVLSGRVGLPSADLLDVPLNEAISEYSGKYNRYGHPVDTYIGLVGLAAVQLATHTRNNSQRLILPAPGLPDDALQRWDYEPPVRGLSKLQDPY